MTHTGLLPTAPPGWQKVPLWTVTRRVDRRGRADAERLSVYREHGVVPTASRADNFNKPGEDLDSYKYVEPGDLVLNKMKTWQGALGISEHAGIVSPAYFVCKVDRSVHPRFLHHLLRSQPYIAMYAALSKGIRPKQWDLPFDEFRKIDALLPPLDEQRRIANFLDMEMARIERLLTLEDKLLDLVSERLASARERVLVGEGNRLVPLQHLTDPRRPIVYGIVQAGEEVPDGVPYIKTGDLVGLDPLTLSRTSTEIDRAYRRARVRPGDLVIAMRASIGLAVKVPSSLPTANLTQGTARIAPREGVDVDWLFHVLRTVTVQDQCHARAVGSTYRTLNIWDLRRIGIPTPPADRMTALGAEVERLSEAAERQTRLLRRKKGLLFERRSAVLTAAVTGQLDVLTARGAA